MNTGTPGTRGDSARQDAELTQRGQTGLTSAQQRYLRILTLHWEDWYDISCDGTAWTARRNAGGRLISAPGPRKLGEALQDDYADMARRRGMAAGGCST